MSKKYVFLFLLIGLLVAISCAGVARSAFALTSVTVSANLNSGKTQEEISWYNEGTSSYNPDQYTAGAYYDANGMNSNQCTSVKGSGKTTFNIYVRSTITVDGNLHQDVDSGNKIKSKSATAARPAWELRPTQATSEAKVHRNSDSVLLTHHLWTFS